MVTDVTDSNFQAEVLESEKPVLVDFSSERDDLRVVKMNVDDNQATAVNYGILAIPTMILFRNGAEAKRIQGAMPRKRIEAELQPALA